MMLAFVIISRCWASTVNWDPDVKFEDCLGPHVVHEYVDAISMGIQFQSYIWSSWTNFYRVFQLPRIEKLVEHLVESIWMKAKVDIPRNSSGARQTSKLLDTKREEVSERNSRMKEHLDAETRTLAETLSVNLVNWQEGLEHLHHKKDLLEELISLSGPIHKRMFNMTYCELSMTNLSCHLELGEEVEHVLEECEQLLTPNAQKAFRQVELAYQEHRVFHKSEHMCTLYDEEINMEKCLLRAKYSECSEVKCERTAPLLFAAIREECHSFCRYFREYVAWRHIETFKSASRDKLQSWLSETSARAVVVAQKTEVVHKFTSDFYNATQVNAQNLARISNCAKLFAKMWEECIEASNWFIWIPFLNVALIEDRLDCGRAVEGLTAVVISFCGAVLLLCLCICMLYSCVRGKQGDKCSENLASKDAGEPKIQEAKPAIVA